MVVPTGFETGFRRVRGHVLTASDGPFNFINLYNIRAEFVKYYRWREVKLAFFCLSETEGKVNDKSDVGMEATITQGLFYRLPKSFRLHPRGPDRHDKNGIRQATMSKGFSYSNSAFLSGPRFLKSY
jgi:hypothetical protein